MKNQISFTAKVEKSPNTGGWHYVLIPNDVHEALHNQSGKNGNVPVIVSIGKSTWQSTTMSMGGQRWFVAIKADVRQAENIFEGDSVNVAVAPDFDRLK